MKKLFVISGLFCAAVSCSADTAAAPPPSPPPPPPSGETWSTRTFDETMSAFNEALSRAKTNDEKSRILFQMANTCLMQKKYAEARSFLCRILAMDQIDSSLKAATLMSYAESYSAENKHHKARTAYNKILSITNVPPSFHFFAQRKKIEAYLADKHYVKARTESKKLHTYKKIYPIADIVAAYYIAESYLDKKQFDTARKQFDAVVEFNKDEISNTSFSQENNSLLDIYQQKAMLGIAVSYFEQKQYDKAKAEYAKIVKMNRWGKFKTQAANEIKAIEKMQKRQK